MSQEINLYEERLRPRRELTTGRNFALAAGVLLAIVVPLSLWTGHQAGQQAEAVAALQKSVNELQEQVTATSRALSERRVSPALSAETEGARALLAARDEVLQTLESGRQGESGSFSGLMTGFARQAQPDLWLVGFRIGRGGEDIEIRGRALDPAKLPAYVRRLGSEPAFSGRRFAGLEMQERELTESAEAAAAQTAAGASAPSAAAPSGTAPARLPRFVEFTLRSEHAGQAAEADTRRPGS